MPARQHALTIALVTTGFIVSCGGGSSDSPSASSTVTPSATATPALPSASSSEATPASAPSSTVADVQTVSAAAPAIPASEASAAETQRQVAAAPAQQAVMAAAKPPAPTAPALPAEVRTQDLPSLPSITSVGMVIRPVPSAVTPSPAQTDSSGQVNAPQAPIGQSTALVATDLAAELDGDALVPTQTNWSGINCHGQYGNWTRFMPAGIHGSRLSDGSTMRFGLVSDPLSPKRKVFVIRVHKDDPLTSNAKRCEVLAPGSGNTALPTRQDFWFAFSIRLVEGYISRGDDQLLMQWHVDGTPILALLLKDGRLRIESRHNAFVAPTPANTSLATPWRDSQQATDNWMHFVIKARISPLPVDAPYLTVWRNGAQLFDRKGPIGFNSVSLPFAKLGFYHWVNLNNWDESAPTRTVHLRHAVIVKDPLGRYNEAMLRAMVE